MQPDSVTQLLAIALMQAGVPGPAAALMAVMILVFGAVVASIAVATAFETAGRISASRRRRKAFAAWY